MKEVLESARRITTLHAWKMRRIARRERDLRQKHRLLYNAGVPGVRDPDKWRVVSESQLDNDLARMMGIIPPQGYYGQAVLSPPTPEEIDRHFHSGLTVHEEICGFCRRTKTKGKWCSNYRCLSNQKRRGES